MARSGSEGSTSPSCQQGHLSGFQGTLKAMSVEKEDCVGRGGGGLDSFIHASIAKLQAPAVSQGPCSAGPSRASGPSGLGPGFLPQVVRVIITRTKWSFLPHILVTWLLLVPKLTFLGKSHEPVELAGAASSIIRRPHGCLARAWASSCRPGAASTGPPGPARAAASASPLVNNESADTSCASLRSPN